MSSITEEGQVFLEYIQEDIEAEYERQEKKFGTFWRSIPYWDQMWADDRMASVLTEEFLEFIRANNDDEIDERLAEEALQTAVVALRIIETIRKRNYLTQLQDERRRENRDR
jgi:hypothetical protein